MIRSARSAAPIFVVLAGFLAAAGLADSAGAQAQDPDLAALNAKAASLDAQDYPFVQPVCTRCHTPEMFLHSRTWSEWRGNFNPMSGYGAAAPPEQKDHIHKNF